MPIYTSKKIASASFHERLKKPPSETPVGGGGDFRGLLGPGDHRPRAILFRQVATPNYELKQFLRLCRRSGFSPVVLSYHADQMSCHNAYKRALVAPMFVKGISRRGQPFFRRDVMINVETVDRRRLSDINVADRSLPEFHHALLGLALADEQFTHIEGSGWFGKYPGGARDYYVDLFIGLTDGLMLLEDFISDSKEAVFFDRIVRPAFDVACKQLGQRPTVLRLCENRRMESPLWYAYPDSYRAHFATLGCPL